MKKIIPYGDLFLTSFTNFLLDTYYDPYYIVFPMHTIWKRIYTIITFLFIKKRQLTKVLSTVHNAPGDIFDDTDEAVVEKNILRKLNKSFIRMIEMEPI